MTTADSLSYLKKSEWVSRGFGTAELVWNYVLWLALQTPATLSAKQKRTCNQSWLGNSRFLSFPTVFLRFLIRSLWLSHASDWPLWLLWFGFTTLKRKTPSVWLREFPIAMLIPCSAEPQDCKCTIRGFAALLKQVSAEVISLPLVDVFFSLHSVSNTSILSQLND